MSSYVVMPASKAREIANRVLEAVRKGREIAERAYVEGEVKRINRTALVHMGWRKRATYESVLKSELKLGLPYGRVATIRIRFWEQEAFAKRLLTAADLGDPVHVSLEDLGLLT